MAHNWQAAVRIPSKTLGNQPTLAKSEIGLPTLMSGAHSRADTPLADSVIDETAAIVLNRAVMYFPSRTSFLNWRHRETDPVTRRLLADFETPLPPYPKNSRAASPSF